MFHNAVVGVDDGTRAQDAIALAKLLLAPDGKLALAHVHRGDPSTRDAEPGVRCRRARGSELSCSSESGPRRASRPTLLSVGSLSVGRAPASHRGPRTAPISWSCGSHRHSLFGRITLSDHLGEALNGAPCPVAIAPGGYGRASRGAEHDRRRLRRLAGEPARARGGAAAGGAMSAPGCRRVPGGRARLQRPTPAAQTVERAVARAMERLDRARRRRAARCLRGHDAEELALYGASVDLLVVGSRGYGPLGRLIHGEHLPAPGAHTRPRRAARAHASRRSEEPPRSPAWTERCADRRSGPSAPSGPVRARPRAGPSAVPPRSRPASGGRLEFLGL